MRTHDPLCSRAHPDAYMLSPCDCDLIERVEQRTQEKRMAAADIAFLDAVQAQERLAAIEVEIEAQITHMDVVDPNGRPRPCQEEWPGGRCNCQRGKVLAIVRGETT